MSVYDTFHSINCPLVTWTIGFVTVIAPEIFSAALPALSTISTCRYHDPADVGVTETHWLAAPK